MFLGHYGLAFGAKRIIPNASLGTLAFATQFLDELWPILLLFGVEQVRIVPGAMAGNPLVFTSYPYSHSLLMAIVWGALIAAVHYAAKRNARTACVIGLIVISHWFLDFPVHPADLPLWPGGSARVGLGLWNSIPITLFLELAFFGGGLLLYVRQTRARDRVGTWGLWSMVLALLLIFLSGYVSPPPPNERVLAWSALALWLFAPWSYWVDRHRERI
ncbi:MAG TPA: metal-dependent hydrolase [Gemmatimonadaceae bacterium]|nr:metal-dependent hydrolase [Gemmatimonadaceae bacterium]